MTQRPVTQNESSVQQSDIAVFNEGYIIWITNAKPAVLIQGEYPVPTLPDNAFPFTRLASITLADGSYYLYHQINGTTLVEEQWDGVLQAWTATEYISISYS